MARGITEADVLEAADALLARGERPTIERVRQELGRGSPNTVNRHLDVWWTSLAARMQGRGDAALPAALLELCGRLYAGIRDQAQAEVQATLSAGKAELKTREADLETQKLTLTAEKAATQAATEKLGTELAVLRDRNEALVTERAQLQAELERLQGIAREAEASAQAARAAVELTQTSHRTEVQRIRGQWEGNETRWLREIDHLRDEAKRQRTEHAGTLKGLRDQIKEADVRLATAAKYRLRLEADLAQEREARIAAEAAGRATEALVKTLTPKAASSQSLRHSGRAKAKPSAPTRRPAAG